MSIEKELTPLEIVNNNIRQVNEILQSQNLNSLNLKKLLSSYQILFSITNDILYQKNIADIYYFYFNQKEKALNCYLDYCKKYKNDSSVYHIISVIYKNLKDINNSKKYFELAMKSSYEKVETPIPDSDDIILGLNIGVAAGLAMNDNVMNDVEIYKNLIQYAPNSSANIFTACMQKDLKDANELFREKCWKEALIKYKSVFNEATLSEGEFIKLITCLSELNEKEMALEYLKRYEERAEDKDRANYVVADLLFFKFGEAYKSIERYERYIISHPDDALTNNTLGHLYSTYYKDKMLDKQLEYFLKAYNLNPNSKVFTKNVALTYSRLGDYDNCKKYYEQLLRINPSYDDFFDYGCTQIQNGHFKEGYKNLMCRFQKETSPALYPPMLPKDLELRNKEDIKGNTILVQCEQGFGDSIMYSRFINQIAEQAKEVILIVQNELVDLFKTSNINADIYGTDINFAELRYDWHVPIMNLPVFLETTKDNIPLSEGYLSVDKKKTEHFKYEFIKKSKKIKIGLGYSGHSSSQDSNRDIPLNELLPILEMKNAEIYILQHDDYNRQIENLPEGIDVINIGKDFSTFEDTAAAMMNMDYVITTDNVLLNLAGALGVKTLGIFNKFPEYRWFDLKGDDTVWYKSVKPYQTNEMNIWHDVVNRIKSDIENK